MQLFLFPAYFKNSAISYHKKKIRRKNKKIRMNHNLNLNPRIKCRSEKSAQSLGAILHIIVAALLLALLTEICGGCAPKQERKKLKDLEYTIVEDNDIPKKLMETIEQKKEAEFKISFESDDVMYLVHGYGEQETGGYSIVVRDLYLTEKALYFDTELLGPENGSKPQKKPSYPYIVVKTAKQKQNIVFE